jgi:hypothetical protein
MSRYKPRKRKPWKPKYGPGLLCAAGLVKGPNKVRKGYYDVICRKCGIARPVREQKLFIIQLCKKCTGQVTWAARAEN